MTKKEFIDHAEAKTAKAKLVLIAIFNLWGSSAVCCYFIMIDLC